ncbi:MAG TPA: NAD(P)-dependent oxidoreductase [Stellaceae bacterium]|nr:NAD(P)-dependent oxidoreductase [Stellaceae bacterium]
MSTPPPSEAPALFPVFLDLAGERVLIVGDVATATAKLRALQRCGAALRVVGAAPGGELAALAQAAGAEVFARDFSPGDLDGARLCYVALEDAAAAAAVAAEARRRFVLVNCIDRPSLSDFATPAIVERGPVAIAIATGGAAPALARDLRARIEIAIPPAYGALATFCGRWRRRVAAALAGRAERRRFWDAVLDGPEAAAILRGEAAAEAEALIERRIAGAPAPPRGEIVWIDAAEGDPDLLPLKALRALQRADLVLYDDGVAPAIIDLARREARRVALDAGGDGTAPLSAFRQARQGARIVRLAGAGIAGAPQRQRPGNRRPWFALGSRFGENDRDERSNPLERRAPHRGAA